MARYLKKCPISNERLSLTTQGKDTTVHLKSYDNDGVEQVRSFSLLEFLAALQCHLPSRWEQTTRFFGVYSCRSRGIEKKKAQALAANDDECSITAGYLPEPQGRTNALLGRQHKAHL